MKKITLFFAVLLMSFSSCDNEATTAKDRLLKKGIGNCYLKMKFVIMRHM